MTLQERLRAPVADPLVAMQCREAADALDAKDKRINELEVALMELSIASQSLDNAFSYECRFRDNDRYPLVANGLVVLRTILDSARAALKVE